MQEQQNVSDPAPKKRDRRALNAYLHGLTGQIHILTPADQVDYEEHCKGIHASLAPVGTLETDLAQTIADDRWRLNHAAGIEGAIFAIGTSHLKGDSANNPEVEVAIAQARTWLAEGKNIQLLGLYEQRIQSRFGKNMTLLLKLQRNRKAALAQVLPVSGSDTRDTGAQPPQSGRARAGRRAGRPWAVPAATLQ